MIRKRKGVTLAEMSIVMAVIAIVSLSVVSFVTITSGRGTNSVAKLNAMEELELVEAVVDSWFAQTSTETTDVIVVSGGQVKVNGLSPVYLERETLHVDFPGTGEVDYHFEKIIGLSFDDLKNGDDVLYFCTVTYFSDSEDDTQTYTFCINPRVGETIVPEPTETTTEQDTQQ